MKKVIIDICNPFGPILRYKLVDERVMYSKIDNDTEMGWHYSRYNTMEEVRKDFKKPGYTIQERPDVKG